MNRFFIPLVIALAGAATTASAQATYRFGLRGGGHLATSTVAGSGSGVGSYYAYSSDKSLLAAWQAGVVAEVGWGKLALQPALVFSQKGEKLHTVVGTEGVAYTNVTTTTSSNRYNWLEVPLHFVYTLHGDHGVQFFAGPYVAWAVGGHYTATAVGSGSPDSRTSSGPISYRAVSPNRSFDTGVDVGIGYRRGPLQLHLGYQLGLRNLHQKDTSDQDNRIDYLHNFNEDAAYNRVVQLTGTYFFSL